MQPVPKTNPLKDALLASAGPQPRAAGRPKEAGPGDRRKKLVGARFPEEVHRQVRVACATEGIALREGIREALNDWFIKKKRQPIA